MIIEAVFKITAWQTSGDVYRENSAVADGFGTELPSIFLAGPTIIPSLRDAKVARHAVQWCC